MNFVTYNDLIYDICNTIPQLPKDIDLVVGVPRSGLMVATIISLFINKPVTDFESFINNIIYKSGNTKNTDCFINDVHNAQKILIVEDSVDSGKSIIDIKEELGKHQQVLKRTVFYAAYVKRKNKDLVDFYSREVEQSRMFEWNYLHHKGLNKCCVDIDGVLCVDPSKEQNDDGYNYNQFLKNAESYLIPTREIGCVVSSRLEKYRTQTVSWLNKNKIKYKDLELLNVESKEERQRNNCHAEFKASIYKRKKDFDLFIESNDEQAFTINKLSGKAVFCTSTHTFYPANNINVVKDRFQRRKQKVKTWLKRLLRKMLPKKVYGYLKELYLNTNKRQIEK